MATKGYLTVLLLLATPCLGNFFMNWNVSDTQRKPPPIRGIKVELTVAAFIDQSFANGYEDMNEATSSINKILQNVHGYFQDDQLVPKLELKVDAVSAIDIDMSNAAKKTERKIVFKELCNYGEHADIYLFVRGSNTLDNSANPEIGVICNPMRTKRTIVITITKDMTDQYAALLTTRLISYILGIHNDYVIRNGKIKESTRYLNLQCLKFNGIMGNWITSKDVSDVKTIFSGCSTLDWSRGYFKYAKFCLKPAVLPPSGKFAEWGGRCRNAYGKKCDLKDMAGNKCEFCRNKIRCLQTCELCDLNNNSTECQDYYIDAECRKLKTRGKCGKRRGYLYCQKTCGKC